MKLTRRQLRRLISESLGGPDTMMKADPMSAENPDPEATESVIEDQRIKDFFKDYGTKPFTVTSLTTSQMTFLFMTERNLRNHPKSRGDDNDKAQFMANRNLLSALYEFTDRFPQPSPVALVPADFSPDVSSMIATTKPGYSPDPEGTMLSGGAPARDIVFFPDNDGMIYMYISGSNEVLEADSGNTKEGAVEALRSLVADATAEDDY